MASPRIHLYERLQPKLRELLGEQDDVLLPAERELAELLGVNRRTLRRALEEMEIKGEIMRHPGRGYTRKKSLPKLHQSDRQIRIGFPIWLPRFEDMDVLHSQGRMSILQGIRQEFDHLGYNLDVQFVGSIYKPNYELIQRLLERWDGYITEPLVRPKFENPFAPLDQYRVLVGYENDATHNCVRVDFQQISRMAFRHLAERGAKNILFLGGGENIYIQNLLRTIGVEKEANHHPGINLIYEGHIPENYTAQGYSYIWDAVQKGKAFDAVLCNTIYLATGAVRALMDLGKRVPEDVQVIGSGTTQFFRYSCPRITTITAQPAYIGKMAARMMRNIIEENGRAVASQVLPLELIQGESTGPIITSATTEAKPAKTTKAASATYSVQP